MGVVKEALEEFANLLDEGREKKQLSGCLAILRGADMVQYNRWTCTSSARWFYFIQSNTSMYDRTHGGEYMMNTHAMASSVLLLQNCTL